MRPLRALGIYAVAVFLGGALLAPWVYRLVQSLSQSFPDLAREPFERYVSTTILVVALAGLWLLLREMGATSLREAGLTNPIGHGRQLCSGLLLGLVSLAVVAAIALAFGGRDFRDDLTAARLVKKLTGAVLTAAGVAVMEEALFRGGVFGGLRRVFQWPFALVVSAMIYSLTHFLDDAEHQGPVTWASGLEMLPFMFAPDAGWVETVPRFLNLSLAGLLLGLAYQRTGNLWFSIGLHAGWIFWLAIYRVFTKTAPGVSVWFWGSNKMVDGWLAFGALSLTLVLFTRMSRKVKR